MATIERPHGTTLAALKGIAITTSLLTAGQLGTITLTLPSLYPAAQTSHKLAAQQFKHMYKIAKATGPPAELLTTLICGGLAYLGYNEKFGLKWKLWGAAAVAMISVVPWTIYFMEAPAYKLLWVSEVAPSATMHPGPISTGIGVKVTEASPRNQSPAAKSNGYLGMPGGGNMGKRDGAITPMEEFEPFEDAPMDPVEYEQLKVIKLLKKYNGLNATRTVGPLVAGLLGLYAALTE